MKVDEDQKLADSLSSMGIGNDGTVEELYIATKPEFPQCESSDDEDTRDPQDGNVNVKHDDISVNATNKSQVRQGLSAI